LPEAAKKPPRWLAVSEVTEGTRVARRNGSAEEKKVDNRMTKPRPIQELKQVAQKSGRNMENKTLVTVGMEVAPIEIWIMPDVEFSQADNMKKKNGRGCLEGYGGR
jgi:hypothetical protein